MMASASLAGILVTGILMVGILIFGEVAASWVSCRRRTLGEGVLSIGREGVLGIGSVCVMAKRN